jgi:Arc/MetJ family transcription regulator
LARFRLAHATRSVNSLQILDVVSSFEIVWDELKSLSIIGIQHASPAQSKRSRASESTSVDAILNASGRLPMRTTITIDDDLLAKATKLTGPLDRSAMVHEGLRALIERESARRLARLGGTQRALKSAPRRRREIKS